MGIATFPCPECGADVRMGLPADATIKSVSAEPVEEPGGSDGKVRENACPNGHHLFVFFAL